MTCVTPAPSAQGPGVPGSFACFPSAPQQMGQMGFGRQQMGQYGYNPYDRRSSWDQGNYQPYAGDYGYNQYGQNTGPGGYGNPYSYGGQFGSNYDATSPNWYYQNRQQQFSRSNQDYDRGRYSSRDYDTSRGYDRSNQYDSDTTGSMSRPRSGGYDDRSNSRSSQPYYDDTRND
jgi:hypothetical protein